MEKNVVQYQTAAKCNCQLKLRHGRFYMSLANNRYSQCLITSQRVVIRIKKEGPGKVSRGTSEKFKCKERCLKYLRKFAD